MGCKAERQQDEMFCADCGLRWDVAEEPPECACDMPVLTIEQKALRIAAYLLTPHRKSDVDEYAVNQGRLAVRVVADTSLPDNVRQKAIDNAWTEFPQLYRVSA